MDSLMMTGDAARTLERSVEMVRQYVQAGKLPAIRTAGGKLVFREEDVREFAQKLREKSEGKNTE